MPGLEHDRAYADGYADGFRQGKQSSATPKETCPRCAGSGFETDSVTPREFCGGDGLVFRTDVESYAAASSRLPAEPPPIDMVLFCPRCGTQHVDAEQSEADYHNLMQAWSLNAEPQDRIPVRWTNPPHRSHLCHNCYAVWRPADIPTNGVAQIKTRGKEDNTGTSTAAVPAEPLRPEGERGV